MSTQLPRKPDFAAIEAAAPQSADKRTRLMVMIGNLVVGWSNNESIFIYIIMILMKTDQDAAIIVFGTLNTTRARLDLIQRLAKTKITDKSIQKQLDKLIDRFNEVTKVRNEFNHCLYTVDEQGEITHTHAMKIQEIKGKLQLGVSKKLDNRRMKDVTQTIHAMRDLNRDLWDFLPVLKKGMS